MSRLSDLFDEAQAKLLQQGREEEASKAKSGNLRVGSCGLVDNKGTVIGACMAQAYLRSQGIVLEDIDPATDHMFAGGRSNEDIWAKYLGEVHLADMILREDDIAVTWKLPNGKIVTGRPDIVLMKYTDPVKKFTKGHVTAIPDLGIELKQISALWSARDVLFGSDKKPAAPKLIHVVQAAIYAWRLGVQFGLVAEGEYGGIEYEIAYTSRSDFAVTGDWVKRMFPNPGRPGSEHCEYAYYRNGDDLNPKGFPVKRKLTPDQYRLAVEAGELDETVSDEDGKQHPRIVTDLLKVRPFVVCYPIGIDTDGQVGYQTPDGEWHDTIVNVRDIEKWYTTLSALSTTNTVPAEPKLQTSLGEKLNYKQSDYCSLAKDGLCCMQNVGKPLDNWVKRVRQSISKSK